MSKPFGEYGRPYREAWATHMVLRNLGFTPDQLFVHRNETEDGGQMFVVLKHQGKQFSITVGQVGDDWIDRWTEVTADSNSRPHEDAELEREYLASYCWANKEQLLTALLLKGITPPYDKD